MKITVFTGCWGEKYPAHYVDRLHAAVKRNLNLPFSFEVLTDQDLEFKSRDVLDLPAWWPKVGLFKPGFVRGSALWLDLDTVVVGSLDQMVMKYAVDHLAAPNNWAKSGHGGVQSSVMIWHDDSARVIWDEFEAEEGAPVDRLHGDQEWITELRDSRRLTVEPIYPEWVASYKYHCGAGLPPQARVVAFHGKPDPHEVFDSWVTNHWRHA